MPINISSSLQHSPQTMAPWLASYCIAAPSNGQACRVASSPCRFLSKWFLFEITRILPFGRRATSSTNLADAFIFRPPYTVRALILSIFHIQDRHCYLVFSWTRTNWPNHAYPSPSLRYGWQMWLLSNNIFRLVGGLWTLCWRPPSILLWLVVSKLELFSSYYMVWCLVSCGITVRDLSEWGFVDHFRSICA